MTLKTPLLSALSGLALAGAAGAHPHIFVETGLTPVFADSGRLSGVEVTWRYDEFYSLLVLEDMELDSDYDGKLTDAETARLAGFDLHWIKGYKGDLYISQGGKALRLGPPEGRGTSFEDGKITSRHFRTVEGGQAGQPWLIQAYDPTYYTAYEMSLGIDLPRRCRAEVAAADLDAAQEKLMAELAKLPRDADAVEANYPEVGKVFAEKVTVSCAADY